MPETNYRLYIDESGTHDYRGTGSIERRYLSLTGVIIGARFYTDVFQPELNVAKRTLLTDQDDPLPTLHREEIVACQGPFAVLRDASVASKFNSAMLGLYSNMDYTLIAVVIDKAAHVTRYGNGAYHPYHYCLSVMLERYTDFLGMHSARGDVMAEARGKVEDRMLKGEYIRFYERGTSFRSAAFVQSVLTSKAIKLKPKGIDGLEFADLLAVATKLDVLTRERAMTERITSQFINQLLPLIAPKYHRHGTRSQGYGIKLLK
jgi:hypothetical protein